MDMKGKVIATDLDGTLFYPKKKFRLISMRNRRFLRRFIDDGGRLLIVSSRNISVRDKIADVLERPVDMVGCNGCFVTADQRFIYEQCFDNALLREVLEYVNRSIRPKIFLLSSRNHTFVMKRNFYTWWYIPYYFFQGALREFFVRNDDILEREMNEGYVYKVMLLVGIRKSATYKARDLVPELSERFPNVEFTWTGQMLEITPKACTKSQGIAFYLDYRKISHDNVLVVGDSGNDVSMFDSFPEHSYCMSHAEDEVKAHAKATIKYVSDLEKLLYPSEDGRPSKESKGEKL